MNDWTGKLFVERSNLFLKLLIRRRSRTEELVSGMVKLLNNFGITSGSSLDLCCGNGRISIYMAKKGSKAIGVDISKAFAEDPRRKAEEHQVSGLVTFLEGDIGKLKEVVVNVWTSIGYFSQEDDLNIFRQARELSREGAILFIAETTHGEFISLKFSSTAHTELDNNILLVSRKYDPATSQISASWAFYNKRGEDLEFIDRVEIENHIYSLSELSSLLSKAS